MKLRMIFVTITVLLLAFVIIFTVNKNSNTLKDNSAYINFPETQIEFTEKSDGKLNILFFYGEGCPHCEQEFAYFRMLEEKYKDKCRIYAYEVLNNDDNANYLLDIAKNRGETVEGVPYTIIGNDVFTGFETSMEKDFAESLERQCSK